MIAYLWRLAVALPLVVALLVGAWYAAKRGWVRVPGAATGTPAARLVMTLFLGPGARLAVVDFAGRRLLLAVSRSGTSLLHAADPTTPVQPGDGR